MCVSVFSCILLTTNIYISLYYPVSTHPWRGADFQLCLHTRGRPRYLRLASGSEGFITPLTEPSFSRGGGSLTCARHFVSVYTSVYRRPTRPPVTVGCSSGVHQVPSTPCDQGKPQYASRAVSPQAFFASPYHRSLSLSLILGVAPYVCRHFVPPPGVLLPLGGSRSAVASAL